jgi:hypothetical protein
VFGLVRVHFDDDPYPEALRNVMLACIAGDEAAALDLINGIRFESTPRKTEKWPTRTTIASVMPGITISADTAVSSFRIIQNWKADATHPAFVSRSATLDHICEEKLLRGVWS